MVNVTTPAEMVNEMIRRWATATPFSQSDFESQRHVYEQAIRDGVPEETLEFCAINCGPHGLEVLQAAAKELGGAVKVRRHYSRIGGRLVRTTTS